MVVLYITETGKILGYFHDFTEADAFHDTWHDVWCNRTYSDPPSCTFFKYD